MSTAVVTGATGVIGSRVAQKLAQAGWDVVTVSRSPDPDSAGRPLAADLLDEEEASRAVAGADGVYITPVEQGDDALAEERRIVLNVIGGAVRHGIEHVIMHTAVQANRGDTGARILDNKTPLEEALAASGLGYTILRPAWFLQNLFGAKPYLDQGQFAMPWPVDWSWAATDVEDVATAAVRFFEQGPANRGFDVHIPGGISAQEVGRAVEAVTGRPVGYMEIPTSRDAVDAYPISDFHKEIYAELYDHFKAAPYHGEPYPITRALPGFRYGTVKDFVERELYAEAVRV